MKSFTVEELQNIKGIGFKKNGVAQLTKPEEVVPQERMDLDLPGYAWDLLPFKKKPFGLNIKPKESIFDC